MKIINKALKDIKPYKNNPRRNDNAVEAVANSIKEFGFKVPVVLDKNDEIIAGHTRIKAAKKLGLEYVPCVIADDLTDEQVKAFRLADNKVAEKAVWDFEILESELTEICDIDMSKLGFDETGDIFDFIQSDEFISSEVKDTFDLTLSFPASQKEVFNEYIKNHGKKELCKLVKEEVKHNA